MAFHVTPTAIPDVLHIIPDSYGDERGFFMEWYKQSEFEKMSIKGPVVQESMSYAKHGIIRGLHFQKSPFAQGKLVRVLQGKVLDVAVDIRSGSPWYGKSVAYELSAENKHMLWIPIGFAHGLEILEEGLFQYMIFGGEYNKESEGGLRYNDPILQIPWQTSSPQVNERDANYPLLADLVTPFIYNQ